jgi:hypothetical protein
MKNKDERRALTLSKAMFTFGKISKHIYEKREKKWNYTHTHKHIQMRAKWDRERESNAHCVCDKRKKRD